MPATAGETFYDLALRALDDQQSEVAGLRTRAGTILAAAAVVATLLARPVFAEPVPDSMLFRATVAVGVAGFLVVLTATVDLLRTHRLAFSVDARQAYVRTLDAGDVETVHLMLAVLLERRRRANSVSIARLQSGCGIALAGLTLATAGFGTAAALGFGA
jgi:hypothetical protein